MKTKRKQNTPDVSPIEIMEETGHDLFTVLHLLQSGKLDGQRNSAGKWRVRRKILDSFLRSNPVFEIAPLNKGEREAWLKTIK